MSPVLRKSLKAFGWTLAVTLGLCILTLGVLLLWVQSRKEVLPRGAIPAQSKLLNPSYREAADRAMQVLRTAQAGRHFPSVAMAVGVDGQLVWTGTVGYEDVAAARPATADTHYYIASIAKFFTSVALGRLIEEEKLDLKTTFHSVVPDFPPFTEDFTLSQLQRHQAGIRHWRLSDLFNRHWYESIHEAALDLVGDPLLFKPGTRTSYSTPGYTLLALAMEKVAREDYPHLMHRLVLDPAGMHDTFLDRFNRTTGHIATPYFVSSKSIVRIPEFNVSDRWAGGGFLATPADVVRFGNAVLQGEMVSARFRARLLRQATGIDDLPIAFIEEQSSLGMKLTGGGTGWSGRSSLSIYPEQRVVVVIATNTRPADDRGPGIDEDIIAALFTAAR